MFLKESLEKWHCLEEWPTETSVENYYTAIDDFYDFFLIILIIDKRTKMKSNLLEIFSLLS